MHPPQKNKLLLVLFVLIFAVMFLLEARPATGKQMQAHSPSDNGEFHEQ